MPSRPASPMSSRRRGAQRADRGGCGTGDRAVRGGGHCGEKPEKLASVPEVPLPEPGALRRGPARDRRSVRKRLADLIGRFHAATSARVPVSARRAGRDRRLASWLRPQSASFDLDRCRRPSPARGGVESPPDRPPSTASTTRRSMTPMSQPGMSFVGPAVVEDAGTTVVVHPGQSVSMDAYRNIHIRIAR